MLHRSLRVRLILTYSLLVLLCLTTAAGAAAFLLQDYQREIAVGRLADLLIPIAVQARNLERANATDEQLLAAFQEQARDLGVRVLMADPAGTVLIDTGSTLEGTRIVLPESQVADPRSFSRWAQVELANGERWLFVGVTRQPRSIIGPGGGPGAGQGAGPGGGPGARVPTNVLLLAAPEPNALSGLLALAPSLWPAALISLIASFAVGLLFSATISRPVADLTRASEAMSRGDYRQQIPVRGGDELGRLARTFNEMSKQVATSDRAMRDFLANVSHDLRTPLTSIRGFAEAIADGTAKGPAVAEVAGIIATEAERLTKLVEQVLLLSKLESGQTPLASERFELSTVVEGCAERSRHRAAARAIDVLVKAEPVEVVGDPTKIEQVITNLLDNAVKFTPTGGAVTVTLSHVGGLTGSGPRRPAAALRVHNSGSSIDPAELPRVFERFYQADRSRTYRPDGTPGSGLGLAIVREIVHAHGGEVRGESDPARGTTFEVVLPAA